MARESRDSKKLKAILRAEFALKQRLERIDFEEEILFPQVDELNEGLRALPSPSIVVVEHEDSK